LINAARAARRDWNDRIHYMELKVAVAASPSSASPSFLGIHYMELKDIVITTPSPDFVLRLESITWS